jgi:peptide deformylase
LLLGELLVEKGMIRQIVYLGDQVLRRKCSAVEEVTQEIRELATDMLETMVAADGIGIAAPQVGIAVQLAVVDVRGDVEQGGLFRVDGRDADPDEWMPLVFINPELDLVGEIEFGVEGCLSIPDVRAEVERPTRVGARLQLLDGRNIHIEADGLLARALQHEVDHLQGILFIDRLSTAAKLRVKREIKKASRNW